MTNVFQRAQAIRMSGEPWQSAVQRATSQVRYKTQMGGGKRTKKTSSGRKASTKKSSGKRGRPKGSPLSAAHKAAISRGRQGVHHSTPNCSYNKTSQHCRVSARGRGSPQYVAPRASPSRTAHRQEFADRARGLRGSTHADLVDGMRGQYGGYSMDGGAKRGRKKSSGKARKPRKTDNCYQARQEPGRCRLSPHGKAAHTKYRASAPQLANQQRFRAASAAARGQGHAPGTHEFGDAFRASYHGQGAQSPSPRRATTRATGRGQGRSSPAAKAKRAARAKKAAYQASPQSIEDQENIVWDSGRGHSSKKGSRQLRTQGQYGGDGFSDTSSTRSSDFTSVSDTTSYTMSAKSYDSSSLW